MKAIAFASVQTLMRFVVNIQEWLWVELEELVTVAGVVNLKPNLFGPKLSVSYRISLTR